MLTKFAQYAEKQVIILNGCALDVLVIMLNSFFFVGTQTDHVAYYNEMTSPAVGHQWQKFVSEG